MSAGALAFAAGALGLLGLAHLGGDGAIARGPRAARAAAGLVDVVVRVGSEGRDPGAVERRRLLLAGAAVAGVTGLALAGPLAGLALGAGGPWLVSRMLRARREHYRRAVEREAAGAGGGAGRRAGGRSLPARRAGRGGRRACRAPPGTSCGAWRPSWPRARRPTTRSRRCAPGCRRRGSTPWWRPAWSSAAPAATWPGCCASAPRRSATRHGWRTRSAARPRRRASRAWSWCCCRWAGRCSPSWRALGSSPGLWSSFLTAWLVGIAVALQIVAAVAIRRLGRVRW